MELDDFEDEIDFTILERGRDYYFGGLVEELEKITDTRWGATVVGSDIYHVWVELSGKEIVEWFCDCPYDWGPICKHVVAVLYAASQQQTVDEKKNRNSKPRRKSKSQQIDDILNKISFEELQSFIRENALNYNTFTSALLARFADLIEEDPDKKYKQMIKMFARSGADRHGFINYQSSFNVMRSIENLLGNAERMLEEENYQESLSIGKAIIEEVSSIIQNMDDSSGSCGYVFKHAGYMIIEIYQNFLSKSEKTELFDYLFNEYRKKKYHDYGFASELMDILQILVDDQQKETKLLSLLEQLIRDAKKEGEALYLREYLGLKVNLLLRMGKEDEANEILKRNIQIPDFRKILIDQAVHQKKYRDAEKLVIEGMKQPENNSFYTRNYPWEEEMLRIAELIKDQSKIRRWSEILFFKRDLNIDYFKKLKKTFTENEWKNVVEEILRKIRGGKKVNQVNYINVTSLARIYVEENMLDQLLNLLQSNDNDLSLVDKFAPQLQDKYPGEILTVYNTAVNKFAANTGRDIYQQVVKYLRKMCGIKGGEVMVKSMVDVFRQQYKNRPAIMEILNRNFS
jgi:hypothetical protein